MTEDKYSIVIKDKNRVLVEIEDISFKEGKINLLFGESGIGKSLIARAIYGQIDYRELDVKINNTSYEEYLNSSQVKLIKTNGFFVFQEPSSHLNPLMSIKNQISEGSISTELNQKNILSGLWKNSAEYEKLLDLFPKPFRPSGGEKQRLLLAMAFKKMYLYLNNRQVNDSLFVFDEPTGSLDDSLRNQVLSMLIENYSRKKFTSLFITHDYSIISEIQKSYNKNMDNFDFLELYRGKNQLKIRSFSPDSYVSWVNSLTGKIKSGMFAKNKPLLTLEPEIKVFGKSLKIFKDNNAEKQTPLNIYKNSMIYLKGESGIGKTTIAKMLMGLIQAEKIRFNLDGLEVNEHTNKSIWQKKLWGKVITMTFQHADESLNQNATVKNILLSLPKSKRPSKNKFNEILYSVYGDEIDSGFINKKIRYLSGGQKQKLNILRALLLETPLLILDEPLNGMDFESIKGVINLLQERMRMNTGILLISHNEEIFNAFVDKNCVYRVKDYYSELPSYRKRHL